MARLRPAGERPSWDEYFVQIARVVSSRATCLRRQLGAVIVREKRMLATGYNGVPSGLPHCAEVGCIRELMGVPSGERHELCRGLHAEQNAIIQAALYGVSVKGGTIYTMAQPCAMCAKMIINAGLRRVVYCEDYPDALAAQLLREAGVAVEQHSGGGA